MEMKEGVRCWRLRGRTRADSPRSYGDGEPYEVMFQSKAWTQKKETLKKAHIICGILRQAYCYISSSPVIVKIPTTKLMLRFPSRAISIPVAALLFCSLLDLKEAQMPVPRTSR
ncbi:hypothetical protein F7725_023613 [Dissostichus mawsoni]|uniref:Uncharacterized protein n=1 Tax=Dissostichus mawsoni TaxID=36200 RepID=A0A7J5XX34_DISMA|nr:hypothetical protein F7725_023613 [Dissostichus mawsoni]